MQPFHLPPNGIPSREDLHYLTTLEVIAQDGSKVKFGSLCDKERTLVVFVRHFLCGKCGAYASQLSDTLTADKLQAAGLKIIIVGCGSYEPIAAFRDNFGVTFPVYADPTRALFKKLGCSESLETTPKGQTKKSYVPKSAASEIFSSITFGLRNFRIIGKTGDIKQNGGEFVFGPGEVCSFAHRMQNSEDHTDLAELYAAIGVAV